MIHAENAIIAVDDSALPGTRNSALRAAAKTGFILSAWFVPLAQDRLKFFSGGPQGRVAFDRSQTMIYAAHVIITAYGFWLPNDPRGSYSDFIRAFDLLKYGNATKTNEARSVADAPRNSALRAAAKKELMYPPVIFSGRQAAAISYGFADVVARTMCLIYACAIMPDHVHLVIGRHSYEIQQLVNFLKGGATTRLRKHGLDPFSGCPQGRVAPSPWAHKYWKVWLDSHDDVERSIVYTNDNPTNAGLKPQTWKFVTKYTY